MVDEPKLDPKQCMTCRRVMSTSYFGSCRSTKDRLRLDCKLCVNLIKRQAYFKKNGHARPDRDPVPTTNPRFKEHNDQVASLGLLRQTYACLGHDVVNHIQYRVEFGFVDFLARVDIYEGEIRKASLIDGKSDAHQFKKLMLNWLCDQNIRLEKNELDLHNSLREVYFI